MFCVQCGSNDDSWPVQSSLISHLFVNYLQCAWAWLLILHFCLSVRYVQERLIVQAICGRSLAREKMLSVDVCCDFVEPLLRISETEMNFEIFTVSTLKACRKNALVTSTTVILANICLSQVTWSSQGFRRAEACRMYSVWSFVINGFLGTSMLIV